MLVPTAVQDLDATHAALDQSASKDRAGRVRPLLFTFGPYMSSVSLRFAGQIGQLRNAGLHAKRHFVLRDPCLRFRVTKSLVCLLVQLVQRIEHRAAIGCVDTRRVLDVQHRIATAAKRHAVVAGRQKSAAPHPREQRLR